MGPSQFLVSFLTGLALSQTSNATNAAHPDPFAVSARVPPLTYQSALKAYRPLTEEKITPWRESNEVARQLGGWSAFAGGREPNIQAPESGSKARYQPVTPAKPDSEAGHPSHGRR